MSCECRCCATGARCAHVLVLSPRDVSDAARVLLAAGEHAGQRVVDLSVSMSSDRNFADERRSGKLETVTDVSCRSCRKPHPVFSFVAEFIALHRVTVHCEGCR